MELDGLFLDLYGTLTDGDRRAAQRLWRVAIVEQWARQFLDTAYPMRNRPV